LKGRFGGGGSGKKRFYVIERQYPSILIQRNEPDHEKRRTEPPSRISTLVCQQHGGRLLAYTLSLSVFFCLLGFNIVSAAHVAESRNVIMGEPP
jgi:hypothetical protein